MWNYDKRIEFINQSFIHLPPPLLREQPLELIKNLRGFVKFKCAEEEKHTRTQKAARHPDNFGGLKTSEMLALLRSCSDRGAVFSRGRF